MGLGGLKMNRNSVVLTGMIAGSAEIKKKQDLYFGEWTIKVIDPDNHVNFVLIRTPFLYDEKDTKVLKEFRAGKTVTISGLLRVSPDRSAFYVRAEDYEILEPDAEPGELF